MPLNHTAVKKKKSDRKLQELRLIQMELERTHSLKQTFTLQEIAEYCGVSKEAVRLWERQAIKSFREKWKKYQKEW